MANHLLVLFVLRLGSGRALWVKSGSGRVFVGFSLVRFWVKVRVNRKARPTISAVTQKYICLLQVMVRRWGASQSVSQSVILWLVLTHHDSSVMTLNNEYLDFPKKEILVKKGLDNQHPLE